MNKKIVSDKVVCREKPALKLVSVAEDIIPIENQRVIKKFLLSLQAMSNHLERFQTPLTTLFPLTGRYPPL